MVSAPGCKPGDEGSIPSLASSFDNQTAGWRSGYLAGLISRKHGFESRPCYHGLVVYQADLPAGRRSREHSVNVRRSGLPTRRSPPTNPGG